MIPTTYNGQDVYLLHFSPDWKQNFKASFSLIAQSVSSLSNRESRMAFSDTLRVSSQFKITLSGEDARQFDSGLRDHQAEPLVIPFWPSLFPWADRADAPITAGLKIAFKEDWSEFELYEGVEPSSFVPDYVCAAVWGRIEKRSPKWLSGDVLEFTVEHVEASPASYALTCDADALDAGPTPAGYAVAPKIFDLSINFQGITRTFSSLVNREEIGFTREAAETLYPHTNYRWQESQHTFKTGDEIARFIEFFRAHGTGASFWTPTWVTASVLTASAIATDTVLNVQDTKTVRAGDWLAFVDGGEVIATGRVQSVAANTITLTGAIGVDLNHKYVLVSHLLLCRLEKNVVNVEWFNTEAGQSNVAMREVPAEYAPAADEALGVTLGKLPGQCFLYAFSRAIGGGIYYTRYTSYEKDLNYGGNVYSSGKHSHSDVTQSVYLDRDEINITSFISPGNPLIDLASIRSEVPLFLTIYKAEVDGDDAVNASVIFSGEVTSAGVRGSAIKARAVMGGTMFDRKVPRFRLQPGCNHTLFSSGCGLVKANWEFSAQIQAAVVPGYPYELTLKNLARSVVGLGMPTLYPNWFANGWIEFGVGNAKQIRPILSSLVSGANLIVGISRDFNPLPAVNDLVLLYPGCDQRDVTCKPYHAVNNPEGKFDNYVNFGGHPFLPPSNPSLVKLSTTVAGGKK